jgi:hypothetical protein
MAEAKQHRNLRVGPVWDRCLDKAHDRDGVPLAEVIRVFLDAYDADDPAIEPLLARLRAEGGGGHSGHAAPTGTG